VNLGYVRTAVVGGYLHEEVVGTRFRIFDDDVEVAVVGENSGVDELVFGIELSARMVGADEVGVRELTLWILVDHFQIGRRGRGIDIEVVLLDVLAVVALAVREAEQTLFEDRITAIPQREREA